MVLPFKRTLKVAKKVANRLLLFKRAHRAARIADSERVGRYVMSNHRPCTDDTSIPNGHPRHDTNVAPNPNVVTHDNGFSIFQTLIALGDIERMGCRVKTTVGTNKHMITKNDPGGIQNHEVAVGKEILSHMHVIAIITLERLDDAHTLARGTQQMNQLGS